MPLFHYSHFCRILRQKKKKKKCRMFVFSHSLTALFIKCLEIMEAEIISDTFTSSLFQSCGLLRRTLYYLCFQKKEKRATKITPRREKSHISMWVHHKYQRKWFWSCCFEMKRSNSVASTPPTIRVKPDHEKIHNNGADTVKRLHIFLWNKVKDFVF